MKSKFSYLLAISAILFGLASCGEKVQTDQKEEEDKKPEVVGPSFDKTKISLTQKELRGVWFTTVWNIDWPKAQNNTAAQKAELIEYFDLFKSLNMNAVFFQVRGMADAFYDSKYEPWSKVFTGVKGKNPGWDPIAFAVEEAHKRGMQLHVWMNPYRIETRASKYSSFSTLDPKISKDLVKDYDKIRMYNPALPEARQRIADIVKEVITKYDVDGVHFDDYFYPSKDQCGGDYGDQKEYEKYKTNGQNITQFRFENVNKMVTLIQKTIQDTKPNVIYTISPAGNMDYNRQEMFADVTRWCSERWIDAVIPQLYWGRRYFDPRLEEFCTLARKTPVIVGYGTYNFEANPPSYNNEFASATLFQDEHNFASQKKQVLGSMHYNASALKNNKVGITDMVAKVYQPLRLLPYFGRAEKPASPTNAKVSNNLLKWDGAGVQYAVYKDKSSGNRRGRAAELIAVTKEKEFKIPGKGTYYVTALDKYNNESLVTDMIEVK